jgi:uncharacterized protein
MNDVWDAAEAGDLSEVQRLVGGDPRLLNAKGRWSGSTPLMLASRAGRAEVMRWLVDRGAAVGERSNNGYTALSLASSRGHTPVVRLLLEGGADPTFVHAFGSSPLIEACKEGRLEALRCLLDHPSAAATINHRDSGGTTALYWACVFGYVGALRALLEKGADPAIVDRQGNSPMAVARRYKQPACVEALEVRSSLPPSSPHPLPC